MKFSDIPKFPFASYRVNISWVYLQDWIDSNNEDIMRVDMNPIYQRGYIWTEAQKIAYIEYRLQGGFSGKDIFWNCPTWMNFKSSDNVIEIVDGKQRIQTVLDFLSNKIRAFGLYYNEFENFLGIDPDFIFHVNTLKNSKEIIKWYIGFNTGGSMHTEEDLKPAFDLLKKLESDEKVLL